jgi:hypothetical protein
MVDPSTDFGNRFNRNFTANTVGYTALEIPLFKALKNTLTSMNRSFHIETYHGGSNQVKFRGNVYHARLRARCELSDLLVITYSMYTRSARLSYIQAKSERATLIPPIERHKFNANLEQWYLLSQRPSITGVGKFNPPSDILSNAILPSVGSFVFFYKDYSSNFQVFYSTADCLGPIGAMGRYGKVAYNGNQKDRIIAGYKERTFASNNFLFARSLYRMEIGTPLLPIIPNKGITSYSLGKWIVANLQTIVKYEDPKKQYLINELLDILGTQDQPTKIGSLGTEQIIILKSDYNFS